MFSKCNHYASTEHFGKTENSHCMGFYDRGSFMLIVLSEFIIIFQPVVWISIHNYIMEEMSDYYDDRFWTAFPFQAIQARHDVCMEPVRVLIECICKRH